MVRTTKVVEEIHPSEMVEEESEIMVAGTSIANLLVQHEQRLRWLEEDRIAALEKRLEDLEQSVSVEFTPEKRMGLSSLHRVE